jgi:hypothetical protein
MRVPLTPHPNTHVPEASALHRGGNPETWIARHIKGGKGQPAHLGGEDLKLIVRHIQHLYAQPRQRDSHADGPTCHTATAHMQHFCQAHVSQRAVSHSRKSGQPAVLLCLCVHAHVHVCVCVCVVPACSCVRLETVPLISHITLCCTCSSLRSVRSHTPAGNTRISLYDTSRI